MHTLYFKQFPNSLGTATLKANPLTQHQIDAPQGCGSCAVSKPTQDSLKHFGTSVILTWASRIQKKLRTNLVFRMTFDVMMTLPNSAHHIQVTTWAANPFLECLTWGQSQLRINRSETEERILEQRNTSRIITLSLQWKVAILLQNTWPASLGTSSSFRGGITPPLSRRSTGISTHQVHIASTWFRGV